MTLYSTIVDKLRTIKIYRSSYRYRQEFVGPLQGSFKVGIEDTMVSHRLTLAQVSHDKKAYDLKGLLRLLSQNFYAREEFNRTFMDLVNDVEGYCQGLMFCNEKPNTLVPPCENVNLDLHAHLLASFLRQTADELARMPVFQRKNEYLRANLELMQKFERFRKAAEDHYQDYSESDWEYRPDFNLTHYELICSMGEFVKAVYKHTGRREGWGLSQLVLRWGKAIRRERKQAESRLDEPWQRYQFTTKPFTKEFELRDRASPQKENHYPHRESLFGVCVGNRTKLRTLYGQVVPVYIKSLKLSNLYLEEQREVERKIEKVEKEKHQGSMKAYRSELRKLQREKEDLQKKISIVENLGIEDILSGVWRTLDIFNYGSLDLIARIVGASAVFRAPKDFVRCVGVARKGVAFAFLLALCYDMKMSIVHLDPSFDLFPWFPKKQSPRVLLVDDQIQTGMSFFSATKESERKGYNILPEQCLSISRLRNAAFDHKNTQKSSDILACYREIDSLTSYNFDEKSNSFQPGPDLCSLLSTPDRKHSIDLLINKLKPYAIEPDESFVNETKEQIRKKCSDQRGRFYKRALLVEDPELLLRIARILYWSHIRNRIDTIIATSRFALPIAVGISLISMADQYVNDHSEAENCKSKVKILLSQESGKHVPGLLDHIAKLKLEERQDRLALMSAVVDTRLREKTLKETLPIYYLLSLWEYDVPKIQKLSQEFDTNVTEQERGTYEKANTQSQERAQITKVLTVFDCRFSPWLAEYGLKSILVEPLMPPIVDKDALTTWDVSRRAQR